VSIAFEALPRKAEHVFFYRLNGFCLFAICTAADASVRPLRIQDFTPSHGVDEAVTIALFFAVARSSAL
jgi:hypothetical protein